MKNQAVKEVDIRKFQDGSEREMSDLLAVEEPLEIRLEYGPAGNRVTRNLSVTMRTPGADEDLTAGFLFTEGIVRRAEDVVSIKPGPQLSESSGNVITASLHPDLNFDLQKLERHFYTTSSCGVCGKTSIEAVKTALCETWDVCQTSHVFKVISPEIIFALPEKLRQAQATFDATGGLHAAAFFSQKGELISLREDVGRHNALDKLIGSHFLQGKIPVDDVILLLSGRASFELLQKAAMAGIRVVCAVGAPSSLAVETAESFGIALIGFLREGRFNLYSNASILAH
jgi:FdhD protein